MTINRNIARKSVFFRLAYVIPLTLFLTMCVAFIFQCGKNNTKEKEAEELYQKGMTLRRNGQTVEAFKEFKKAITIYPKHFLAQKDFMVASKKNEISATAGFQDERRI